MMGHPHHHGHAATDPGHVRLLAGVLLLTIGFTVVEAVGGWLTGSLALLADAGHMLSDSLSLGLALFAAWIGQRPPTPRNTYGYRRAEILAALVNGVTLVAVSLWIFIEAYQRFWNPPQILGGWMLVVAVLGLLVNALAAYLLSRAEGENLNVAAAHRHVLADLLGSVGAISAAVVILLTPWTVADPLISVLIALLILISSWSILRDSVNILMEATPEGIHAEEIHEKMMAQEGIREVHDLHIWTIASGLPALTAHILVARGDDLVARRRVLEQLLHDDYHIEHTTIQMDYVGEESCPRDGLERHPGVCPRL